MSSDALGTLIYYGNIVYRCICMIYSWMVSSFSTTWKCCCSWRLGIFCEVSGIDGLSELLVSSVVVL